MTKPYVRALSTVTVAALCSSMALSQVASTPTEEQCIQSFDLDQAIAANPRKLGTTSVQDALNAYAICQALKTRKPSYCGLMGHYKGNGVRSCKLYFTQMLLFRDIAAGMPAAKLGKADAPMCQRLSQLILKSPDKSGALCAAIADSYHKRHPFCTSLAQRFPDDVTSEGVQRCEADQRDFEKDGHMVLGSARFTSAVIKYMWSREVPQCGTFPFNGPLNDGSCVGLFAPDRCDDLLASVRREFCAARRPRT